MKFGSEKWAELSGAFFPNVWGFLTRGTGLMFRSPASLSVFPLFLDLQVLTSVYSHSLQVRSLLFLRVVAQVVLYISVRPADGR